MEVGNNKLVILVLDNIALGLLMKTQNIKTRNVLKAVDTIGNYSK